MQVPRAIYPLPETRGQVPPVSVAAVHTLGVAARTANFSFGHGSVTSLEIVQAGRTAVTLHPHCSRANPGDCLIPVVDDPTSPLAQEAGAGTVLSFWAFPYWKVVASDLEDIVAGRVVGNMLNRGDDAGNATPKYIEAELGDFRAPVLA